MKRFDWGELIVPALMAAFAIAYWRQAAGLSFTATLLPGVLTAIMVLMAGLGLWQVARQDTGTEDRPRRSPVVLLRQAAVVLVPLLALWQLWTPLGGMLSITLATLLLAILLGERRPLVLLLLAVFAAVVVEGLFVHILHARVPEGVLGQIF